MEIDIEEVGASCLVVYSVHARDIVGRMNGGITYSPRFSPSSSRKSSPA